jgi:hypothetical protein
VTGYQWLLLIGIAVTLLFTGAPTAVMCTTPAPFYDGERRWHSTHLKTASATPRDFPRDREMGAS